MNLNAHDLFLIAAAIGCAGVLLTVAFQLGQERAITMFQARTDALTERTRQLQEHLADAKRECEVLRADMEQMEQARRPAPVRERAA